MANPTSIMNAKLDAQEDGRSPEEQELCPQCLLGNRPGIPFCRNCGAPLSAYAATGPFESLFAEGNAYRRAAEEPRRLIVVLGIWLIFGIMAGTGVLAAATAEGQAGALRVVVGCTMVAFSVFIITKTTRNFLRLRAQRPLTPAGPAAS